MRKEACERRSVEGAVLEGEGKIEIDGLVKECG
jgi:hypothetical protein